MVGAKPISAVEVGDTVLASNEPAGSTGVSTVTATIHHTDAVVVTVTLDGEALETTPAHPFSVLLRGWVNAEDLRPGMAVRRADGNSGAVEGVAVEQRTQAMNHLTVADAHTFVVGEDAWVVHNDPCPNDIVEELSNGGTLRSMEVAQAIESGALNVRLLEDAAFEAELVSRGISQPAEKLQKIVSANKRWVKSRRAEGPHGAASSGPTPHSTSGCAARPAHRWSTPASASLPLSAVGPPTDHSLSRPRHCRYIDTSGGAPGSWGCTAPARAGR
ncbi:MAG: hypothetical protein HGA19_05615 [Oscillochloris sp.]|nr:hypothetical protein [Oscillochloris sp.]